MKDHYDQLRQFFGSYFHQDWDIEGDTWEAIIKAYQGANDPRQQRFVSAQIDSLIKDFESGYVDSDTFLSDFYCEYNPAADGLSILEWLTKINATLKDRI